MRRLELETSDEEFKPECPARDEARTELAGKISAQR